MLWRAGRDEDQPCAVDVPRDHRLGRARPAPFHRDGRALRVTQVADRWFDDGVFGQIVFTMSAAAPGDRAAGGWLRMSATFFYPVGTTTCDSGRVRLAIATCSIEAFSLSSFWPFAAAESGKTL